MKYNLLTINNITKICDDNIYIDPDNNQTDLQWYDYQINFALNNCENEIPKPFFTHLQVGYKLSRSQKYKIIVKYLGNNPNIIVNKSDKILKKYGLYNKNANPFIFTYDSLGGRSTGKNKNYQSTFIPGQLFTNKYEQINIPIKLDNRCINLGSFNWSDNLCYADSVVIAIIYFICFSSGNNIFKKHIDYLRYDSTNIIPKLNLGMLCNISDNNIIAKKLNNILDEIKKIVKLISTNNNTNLQKLMTLVNINCPDLFVINYSEGRMNDASEFFLDFLKLLNIIPSDSPILNKYFINIDEIDDIPLFSEIPLKSVSDDSENRDSGDITNITIKNEILKKQYYISYNKEGLKEENTEYNKIIGKNINKQYRTIFHNLEINIKNIKYLRDITINHTNNKAIVNELPILPINDNIFFNINRKMYLEDKSEICLDIKIIPDKIIQIGESSYKLQNIILYYNNHYVTVYLCDDQYYLINDIENYNKILIGSYSDLAEFSYKNINNIILRNSTILHYYSHPNQ